MKIQDNKLPSLLFMLVTFFNEFSLSRVAIELFVQGKVVQTPGAPLPGFEPGDPSIPRRRDATEEP